MDTREGVVHEVNICTTPSQCIDLLNALDNEKTFAISSGAIGQNLLSAIHDIPQPDVVYIFCGNKARHEQLASDWSKIEGVYTSIQPICELLKTVAYRCDHDFVPMSFVPKRTIEESASYMYSMLFKEIILELDEDDAKSMKNLLLYCRCHGVTESELIAFQKEYSQKTPVEWYSCIIFLFGMIIFIRNLHRQLKNMCIKQTGTFEQEFQHLTSVKGGLLAFNNFLSTSKEKKMLL